MFSIKWKKEGENKRISSEGGNGQSCSKWYETCLISNSISTLPKFPHNDDDSDADADDDVDDDVNDHYYRSDVTTKIHSTIDSFIRNDSTSKMEIKMAADLWLGSELKEKCHKNGHSHVRMTFNVSNKGYSLHFIHSTRKGNKTHSYQILVFLSFFLYLGTHKFDVSTVVLLIWCRLIANLSNE